MVSAVALVTLVIAIRLTDHLDYPNRELTLEDLGLSTHSIYSRAFSPDGQTFAIATGTRFGECPLVFLDTQTLEVKSRVELCHRPTSQFPRITSMIFSPDGNTLFLNSERDDTIRGLDVATQKYISELTGIGGSVTEMIWQPGENILAASNAHGVVTFWNPETDEIVERLRTEAGVITCASFSGDGNLLLTGYGDGKVLAWDMSSMEMRYQLQAHNEALGNCSFNPQNNDQILTSSVAEPLRIWSLTENREIFEDNRGRFLVSSAYNFDGSLIQYGTWPADNVYIRRTVNLNQIENTIQFNDEFGDLNIAVFSPNSNLLVISAGSSIQFWELDAPITTPTN
jgi:WD40 repeat protein